MSKFGAILVILSVVAAAAGAPPGGKSDAGPVGIAARYPGDKGISAHPAVLLHENFEDSARVLDKKRWPNISNRAGALKIVRDRANVRGGAQSLQVTATLGKNTGGHLFRRFATGQETMHARFCVKFAADIDYIHHFVHMVAQLPATVWPTGGAGLRPAGDKKFSVAIEPHGKWGKYPPPGGWCFYNYWWKMPRAPDGKYWGAALSKTAYAVPKRGQWYCVEFMAKCNTPAKPDGEAAVWIDGKKLAHHKGINWRSSEKLKLNAFWLMLYVTGHSAKKNKINTVWFDDVVVANEYIGPPVRMRDRREGSSKPRGASQAGRRQAQRQGGWSVWRGRHLAILRSKYLRRAACSAGVSGRRPMASIH